MNIHIHIHICVDRYMHTCTHACDRNLLCYRIPHTGLLTQWTKMYQLSLFGSATEKLMKATIDGDLNEGVQFVGQSNGVIDDIPIVQDLLNRVVEEAVETHRRIGKQHIKKVADFAEDVDYATAAATTTTDRQHQHQISMAAAKS